MQGLKGDKDLLRIWNLELGIEIIFLAKFRIKKSCDVVSIDIAHVNVGSNFVNRIDSEKYLIFFIGAHGKPDQVLTNFALH